ncbi:hypothetical protein E2C01_056212 [Portunus trituberculatus]|uniref:Uncharacterized protein n=1 Tax=Portunus trituberculatus TaxID=210409 RepID=A0A5B7GX72_PORTR|nr:hypothetical protein [Portunus trituberculatus]
MFGLGSKRLVIRGIEAILDQFHSQDRNVVSSSFFLPLLLLPNSPLHSPAALIKQRDGRTQRKLMEDLLEWVQSSAFCSLSASIPFITSVSSPGWDDLMSGCRQMIAWQEFGSFAGVLM